MSSRYGHRTVHFMDGLLHIGGTGGRLKTKKKDYKKILKVRNRLRSGLQIRIRRLVIFFKKSPNLNSKVIPIIPKYLSLTMYFATIDKDKKKVLIKITYVYLGMRFSIKSNLVAVSKMNFSCF